MAFSGDQVKDEDLKEILGTISRDLLFQCSSAILEEHADQIFGLVERIIDSGYDLRTFHEELIQHFRNLLLARSVKNPEELLPYTPDDIQKLRDEAAKGGPEDLLRCLLSLQQGEQGMKFSSHPRIYLEAMLIKLCHYRKLTPLKELLKQIEGMEERGPEHPKRPPEEERKPRPAKAKVQHLQEASVPKAVTAPEPSPPVLPRSEEEEAPPLPQENGRPTEEQKTPSFSSGEKNASADAVLKDPAVVNFMQTFKAQILSVEPKKGEKVATRDIKDLVE